MRTRGFVLALSILLAALGVERGEAAGAAALFTAAQARAGRALFEQKCAMCHGRHLQGLSGPALKGPLFASRKAGYTVRDIFLFLSVNMPAYAPGSLGAEQYVNVMSFLLQQNGFPAGRVALTAQAAATSTVALLYHGPDGRHGRDARRARDCAASGARAPSAGHAAPRGCKPLAAAVPGIEAGGHRHAAGKRLR